jgi:hypothetical protein
MPWESGICFMCDLQAGVGEKILNNAPSLAQAFSKRKRTRYGLLSDAGHLLAQRRSFRIDLGRMSGKSARFVK